MTIYLAFDHIFGIFGIFYVVKILKALRESCCKSDELDSQRDRKKTRLFFDNQIDMLHFGDVKSNKESGEPKDARKIWFAIQSPPVVRTSPKMVFHHTS